MNSLCPVSYTHLDAVAAEGDAIPSDFIQGTFKPSETTVQAQDSYEYPFLGLTMKLPEELLKQIKEQTIAMITNAVSYTHLDVYKRQDRSLVLNGLSPGIRRR